MRRGIREKMADMLDLPEELVLDCARLVMVGERELTIENYKGILEYTDKLIRIKTADKKMMIKGDDLRINTITDEELQIKGQIFGIEIMK